MKGHRKIGRKLFCMSLIGYLLAACSVWLVPLINTQEEGNLFISVLIGCLFWLGILMGVFFFVLSWQKVRKDAGYQKIKEKQRPGYLCFFKTKYAFIVDTIMMVSWILVIISNFLIVMPDILVLLFIFLALYTLCLHFMINGRVYSYISKNNVNKKKEKKDEKQN